MSGIRWTWLFLDTPRADVEESWRFWSNVTRWSLSPTRGDAGEFATLLPPREDSWVKLQAVLEGPGGVHLDLDTDDVPALAGRALSLGGRRTGAIGDEVVVLESPGGLPFCLTPWQGQRDQVRAGIPDLVDQVCLDIPQDRHDAEVAFWSELTGWDLVGSDEPELSFLRRPPGIPLRFLFQRLGDPTGPVRAHADIACVDRRATCARHLAAGARVVREHEQWTVMADPVGRVYCVTDRLPTRPPGT